MRAGTPAPGAPAGPPEAPEPRWSLTRRLGRRFALMTSGLIALYALGSSWVMFDTQRGELDKLMDHESREVLIEVQESDGSAEKIRDIVLEEQVLFQRPPSAVRVLASDGRVVGEAGPRELIERTARRDAEPGRRMRLPLVGEPVLVWSIHEPRHDVLIQFGVDASSNRSAFYHYVLWSAAAFLASVGLAALCGTYTARRGLSGLHALVAQTRAIDLPSGAPSALRLDDAPEELAELGQELNAMLQRIEAGLGKMRTFTASLAHELRSPLQNLIGETEVTLLSERDGEEYRRALRSNLDDLHDLSDAIDNLVAYCRTNEPGTGPRERESFDLAAEARLRLQRERRTARRLGVDLTFESSGDTTLFADREAGLRVLRNLVSNALAWSPEGASVGVRIEGLPDRVRIEVDDEGPGIPPELGDRIFEPFVTGAPRRGQRGGYGLGLAICRSVVREHRGELRYEPRVTGGTRFVAEFPRGAPVSRAPVS
jgi:signal transduction histidine kinase